MYICDKSPNGITRMALAIQHVVFVFLGTVSLLSIMYLGSVLLESSNQSGPATSADSTRLGRSFVSTPVHSAALVREEKCAEYSTFGACSDKEN